MNNQDNKGIEHDKYNCEECRNNMTDSYTSPTPIEQGSMEEWEKEFVERGAELEHIRWAKWQNYLHTFLVWNNDIQMWTLPHEKKEWWDSEIRTPYSMLTESQKESDRKETRQYIPLIRHTHTTAVNKALEEQLREMIKITEKGFDCTCVYYVKDYAKSKGLLLGHNEEE